MSTIKLVIKSANQQVREVPDIDPSWTVQTLKEHLAPTVDMAPDRQRLIYKGRVLKDDQTLTSLGVQDGHALHLVRGAPKPSDSSSGAADASTAASTTPSTARSGGTPSQPQQQAGSGTAGAAGNNPFASLFAGMGQGQGAAGAGSAGAGMGMGGAGMFGPSQQQMMASMMQNPAFLEMCNQMMAQMMQNPNMTYEQQMQQMLPQILPMMMQSPQFQQMTQQLASNPEMMQQMMGSLPQMQAMMGGAGAGAGAGAGSAGAAPGAGAGVNPMMNLFAGMSQPQQPQDPAALRERYATQLQQLKDMGFPNEEANLAALQAAQGNVEFALERLLRA
eukprot:Sspe_Gene.39659::Locus_19121_Transcript_1_1_Confidence_1.000_Length_1308::g.39659::m.39659/K04523/UBQLN, DSK2; ubiquilin